MPNKRYIDPWFTRNPKTKFYCFKCQKDLASNQIHRFFAVELDRYEAIAPKEWEKEKERMNADRAPHLDPFMVVALGIDCARKVGLDYSVQTVPEQFIKDIIYGPMA